MNTIQFKRLHPDAHLPTYGSAGAGCFDLYAAEDVDGHHRVVIDTGLAVELPAGTALLIRSRSGLAFGRGLHAFHGCIDADYRGAIRVLMTAEDAMPFAIKKGERIAQGLIVAAPQYALQWADELTDTARGAGGFGSTGGYADDAARFVPQAPSVSGE